MIADMLTTLLLSLLMMSGNPEENQETIVEGIQGYVPAEEIMAAREAFRDNKFGVFIHWGVYSMLANGEWVMSKKKIPYSKYSLLPGGFYPSKFDAAQWVSAIKASGAKYITITSRHHDGFSMFGSKASSYNIVDATPFGRDILKELADECRRQGITLNFYYSLVDWGRADYPKGTSGPDKCDKCADYDHYADFMCAQIKELLTGYGPVGCIWFDGDWDQIKKPAPGEEVKVDFDWQYKRIYELIHSLQPACLVGNNHHRVNIPGEDIQIFERDVPGENTAGYSRTSSISASLPLETCQTMNKSWGYEIMDDAFKSTEEIIRLLVRTAGRNANLLFNVGPQPDGCIPAESLDRLAEVGKWMDVNGGTIYGTRATMLPPQDWGVLTHKDKKVFLHVTETPENGEIILPFALKAKSVTAFGDGRKIAFRQSKNSFKVTIPSEADCSVDYIVEITLR